jgi:hypothetical protein
MNDGDLISVSNLMEVHMLVFRHSVALALSTLLIGCSNGSSGSRSKEGNGSPVKEGNGSPAKEENGSPAKEENRRPAKERCVEGQKFPADECGNGCACYDGEVVCTLKACDNTRECTWTGHLPATVSGKCNYETIKSSPLNVRLPNIKDRHFAWTIKLNGHDPVVGSYSSNNYILKIDVSKYTTGPLEVLLISGPELFDQ